MIEITSDNIDLDLVNSKKWYINAGQARNDSPKGTYLVRLIAQRMYPEWEISRVDFLDGNRLNCQRENLSVSLKAKILNGQFIFGNGKIGFFDESDIKIVLENGPWIVFDDGKGHEYVRQSGPNGKFLHRLVSDCPKDLMVDHISRDGLDNRKSNLRISSNHQNQGNAGLNKRNKTGFRGVSFIKSSGKYRASIKDGNTDRTLGEFITPEEAATVYDSAAARIFGSFANLNFPLTTNPNNSIIK